MSDITFDNLPQDIQFNLKSIADDADVDLVKSVFKFFKECCLYDKHCVGVNNETSRYKLATSKTMSKFIKTEPIIRDDISASQTFSEEEVDAQIKELKDPKLLLNCTMEVQKEGVAGEENSIIVGIVKLTTRLVKNCDPTSQNLVYNAPPGYSKDTIVNAIIKTFMKGEDIDFKHYTGITEQGLVYQDGWDWTGKLLYIEDPKKDLLNSDTFRTFSSGKVTRLSVADQKGIEMKIDGKPAIIVTSYETGLDIQADRRWDMMHTDISHELNVLANIKYVSRQAMEKKNDNLRNGLKYQLKPYEVNIPYLQMIAAMMSHSDRWSIKHLADYIRGSTVLHQYQRKRDKDGKLVATVLDYNIGLFVFYQLHGSSEKSLNIREQELVGFLGTDMRSYREIEENTTLTRHWIDLHSDSLKERKIISIQNIPMVVGTVTKDVKHLILHNDFGSGRINLIYTPIPKEILQEANRLYYPVFSRINVVFNNTYMEVFTVLSEFNEMLEIINKSRASGNLSQIDLFKNNNDLVSKNHVNTVNTIEKRPGNTTKSTLIPPDDLDKNIDDFLKGDD